MSIYADVKAAWFEARMQKKPSRSLLTTLLSDADVITKKNGVEPTDAEMTALIKKYQKSTNEMISLTAAATDDPDLVDACSFARAELAVLTSFMPEQFTVDDIRAEIEVMRRKLKDNGALPWNVSTIMAHFKAEFPGQYDGEQLSMIAKQVYDQAVIDARAVGS